MIHGIVETNFVISAVANLAPLLASDMTLFKNILVSNNATAGDPGSPLYSRLSPPIVRCTMCGSDFRYQMLHLILAYVILELTDTCDLLMKKTVLVPLAYRYFVQFLPMSCANFSN